MNLYDEFFQVVAALDRIGAEYAVVGGIAVSFHAEPRYTKDIDLLFYAIDIDRVRSELNGLGYKVEAKPWTFESSEITLYRFSKFEGEEHMMVDVMVGSEQEHEEIVRNAIAEETDYGMVKVASKKDLIKMKRLRNSAQDVADIEALQNDKD